MLIRFTPDARLEDISQITQRLERMETRFKFIQETGASYLIIESKEQSKLDELYHQFRHLNIVDRIIRRDSYTDALAGLDRVEVRIGKRRVGRRAPKVVMAGSPYLESQVNAVDNALDLADMGIHIYKAGPYRPTNTLPPKGLYARTGSIIKEIKSKAGLPSSGYIEILAPTVAFNELTADALHLPGKFMFDTKLHEQLAKLGLPILLERHPEAPTPLWLKAAASIIENGNEKIVLVETGCKENGKVEIDLVGLVDLIENCPLPVMVYASRASKSKTEVGLISQASLAAGASGVIIDVHPDTFEGLLSEGFCLSVDEFRDILQSLRPYLT